MFSGIIIGLGEVVENNPTTHRLVIKSEVLKNRAVMMGASIAIDGVCLTVVDIEQGRVSFDLGEETRKLTKLALLEPKNQVNIEFSLRVGDDISGHFVQGHVDGLATLHNRLEIDGNLLLSFSYPKTLQPLLVKKGSVALNGVSLTINEIDAQNFSVCLLPYTIAFTNLGSLQIGQKAHIEVDILGRYVANFMPHNLQPGKPHDCTSARFPT